MCNNISKNNRGKAEGDGGNPGQKNNNRCLFNRAVVLGPNWEHHGHTAIHTDDDKEEDAAKHVDKHNEGGEFAHEQAKDPVIHGHVSDAEGETGAEDEVRDGEAQVPGGVDRLLHPEASDPDHQSIPKEAQQKNDCSDQQQSHAEDFTETC